MPMCDAFYASVGEENNFKALMRYTLRLQAEKEAETAQTATASAAAAASLTLAQTNTA